MQVITIHLLVPLLLQLNDSPFHMRMCELNGEVKNTKAICVGVVIDLVQELLYKSFEWFKSLF